MPLFTHKKSAKSAKSAGKIHTNEKAKQYQILKSQNITPQKRSAESAKSTGNSQPQNHTNQPIVQPENLRNLRKKIKSLTTTAY